MSTILPLTHSAAILTDVQVLAPKSFNNAVYIDINRLSKQTAWAHGFMTAYAVWIGPVLLAAVFVAAYAMAWWRGANRAASLLALGGLGTLVAVGLNQVVGHAAKELRPYATHPQALVLVGKTSDYSFPSDHSVVAGGLTVSLLLALGGAVWEGRGQHVAGKLEAPHAGRFPSRTAIRVFAAVNVVLGLFLCFDRLYVGAHYPGDVVAGYLLASATVVAVSFLRPAAYRLSDLMEPTIFGVVLRRPAATDGSRHCCRWWAGRPLPARLHR